jgi:secretion/DNA translocation related TadE-like protein
VIARHRAQAAADLAAVAAAMRVGAGTGAACSQASALARALSAAVAQCVVEDLDVVITVETRVPLGGDRRWSGARHRQGRSGRQQLGFRRFTLAGLSLSR